MTQHEIFQAFAVTLMTSSELNRTQFDQIQYIAEADILHVQDEVSMVENVIVIVLRSESEINSLTE